MDTKDEEQSGMSWEMGTDIYTLLCTKLVIKKPTVQHRKLYSALCDDLNGKGIQKKEDIRRHTADALSCTVETNKTLQSNYMPIKIQNWKKFYFG